MKNKSLLKGALRPLILHMLSQHGQMYGYQLIQHIKEGSQGALLITEGALYPSLHKLEQEGLLEVEFREVSGRNRKYYRLSAKGKQVERESFAELTGFMASLKGLMQSTT